jgi:predicted metal-binding membrane protein
MHSKTLLLLWTLLINLISMLPSDAMFLNSLCNVQKKTCIPQMDVVSVLLRVTFYSGLDTQFSILVKEH